MAITVPFPMRHLMTQVFNVLPISFSVFLLAMTRTLRMLECAVKHFRDSVQTTGIHLETFLIVL